MLRNRGCFPSLAGHRLTHDSAGSGQHFGGAFPLLKIGIRDWNQEIASVGGQNLWFAERSATQRAVILFHEPASAVYECDWC
jgi:hypothetical protein